MFSRAGLVALVFALLISLVSAVPIPSHSGHSTTLSQSQSDLSQRDINKLTQVPLNNPISRVSATTGALTGDNVPVDADNQLVRRGLGAKIRRAFHKLGAKIKGAFHKLGHAIVHVAKKIGSGIKKAAQKVGHFVKKAAQKVGHFVKKAAQKVGHFIKTTGAKIVKFGMKIVSTVAKVASKVVGFIPGVGKLIGKGIEGISKVTGVISDKIHVSLGKKLDKGMAVMNKANKVMGYIPRRRDLSKEEDFY